MKLENPFERHPFGQLMSLAGIKTTEITSYTSRPLYPDIISKYADYFYLQMSRLGNKLIDAFKDRLDETVILTMLRGGIYTGLDLTAFIKAKIGNEIPVEGISILYKKKALA